MNLPETVTWFDDRFYIRRKTETETEYYPSVTTILGDAVNNSQLNRWRGDVGNAEADRRMRAAADLGTAVHEACECLARGGVIYFNPFCERIDTPADLHYVAYTQEEMYMIEKFSRWWKSVSPKLVGVELRVFSDEFRYAGTVDFVVDVTEGDYSAGGKNATHIPGGRYIIDLKTGKNISPNYDLQLAAYVYAANEACEDGIDYGYIGGAILLHVNAQTRTGIEGVSTRVYSAEENATNQRRFLNIYETWKWLHETDKPKVRELPKILTLTEN